MVQWTPDLFLYHGSYCAVPHPALAKCNPNKDFGLGFYVTTSKEQAMRFVPSAIRKAVRLGKIAPDTLFGFVSIYRFNLTSALSLYEFETANVEWLHCVAAHRKRSAFPAVITELEPFDLIAGKIANDQTNATLTAYLSGLYGELGSREADEECIRRLMPERLENQICFRTDTALSALRYEGEERICLNLL